MESRMRIVVLAVLCAVCAVLILVMAGRQDHTAPVIAFEKTSIYYDGKHTDTLLEGVTAIDARDGDVSDTLMISAIYPVSDETGIVVYAAKDSSNNVTTMGRGFFYQGYDTAKLLQGTGLSAGDAAAGAGESEISPGAFGDENETETGAVIDGDTDGTSADDSLMGDVEYDRLREENLAQGIPFVRLVQYEAVLERGSAFNIYRYIDEAVDDVDSIQTMLRVEGSVDTNTPGEYEVRVFAKDSDGHESNVEILKVTVE